MNWSDKLKGVVGLRPNDELYVTGEHAVYLYAVQRKEANGNARELAVLAWETLAIDPKILVKTTACHAQAHSVG